MSHYTFATLALTDFAWTERYQVEVPKIIEQYNGRILARTTNVEVVEGDAPQPHVVLLVEFPSREHSERFYNSPEYKPYLQARQKGAKANLFSFSGEDTIATS
tara:strand:+ start:86 stop:394 length:309 start_codon:yes stop_codon:yes gene_type:complete